MSATPLFKTYDPVEKLISQVGALASGGTGGGTTTNALATTGGTMTGNITMSGTSKITQATAPTVASDVTNKQYVDSAVSAVSAPQMSFAGWKLNNASFFEVNPTTQVKLFTNIDGIGANQWTDTTEDAISVSGGIFSIQNKSTSKTMWYICSAHFTGLSNKTAPTVAGALRFKFNDEDSGNPINSQWCVLRSFSTSNVPSPEASAPQVSGSNMMYATISVPPGTTRRISVIANNPSATDVMQLNQTDDVCQIMITRQS
ncbi:hypothetical protein MIV036R [Invertebrate iridescent virus 3]|uniref:Uncharacterized protein 036R n=1 Tax=Invertebrate iridescent virus 3 TaxID=345201 RepID=VF219_IIV3|nr:hypothetical protein MIV036R [Invertebrate iridescent virus 3]Q197C4.1 RecName: Full=Uncharacterized protein 036R [Invertebrate iridescent virus 3]ABF82066.1 hypothetical protein MIV036R [Invertebrate iridescent virus 3]